MFEFIESKKYLYWTQGHFIKEMKKLQGHRVGDLMRRIKEKEYISDQEILNQWHAKKGFAYDMFLDFNNIGGNEFYQEIYSCLNIIDFLGKEKVQGVAFPVKNSCSENIELTSLENQIEDNAEYDFLIKKENIFYKFQLKSVPEKYVNEFDSDYFIRKTKHLTNEHYNDGEMILVYLLQPFIERTSMEKFRSMTKIVSEGIGNELTVKNVYFLVRRDLKTIEYIQIYKELVCSELNIENSLLAGIKK